MGVVLNSVTNVTATNPLTTTVNTSQVQSTANRWFGPSPIYDLIEFVPTESIVTLLPWPTAPELLAPRSSQAKRVKSGIGIKGLLVANREFEIVKSCSYRDLTGNPVALQAMNAIVAAISSSEYKQQNLARDAVDLLSANVVRQPEGRAFFATNHPIDVFQTGKTRRAGALGATQSNLLSSTALSFTNLRTTVAALQTLCTESGLPARLDNLRLLVTPTNAVLAQHLCNSTQIGFSTLFASTDNAGGSDNPLAKLNITPIVMDQYIGTATDWYLVGSSPLFTCTYNAARFFQYIHATQGDISQINNEDVHMLLSDHGMALTPLYTTAIKCTA